MNVVELKKRIQTAKNQANISHNKYLYFLKRKEVFTAFVYETRREALNNYVKLLEKKLNQYTIKITKKQHVQWSEPLKHQ